MKSIIPAEKYGQIISNTIHLGCEDPTKAYIIVEGDNDKVILKRFFKREHCNIITPNLLKPKSSTNRKESVVKIIKHPRIQDRANVFGIVDVDFEYLQTYPEDFKDNSPYNLAYTDNRDFDTQIFYTPAFKEFLTYHCKIIENNKPRDLNETEKKSIKIALERYALELGLFRHFMHNHYLIDRIPGDEDLIPFLTSYLSLILEEFQFNEEIFSKSQYDKYKKFVERILSLNLPASMIIRGHDVYAILTYIIQDKSMNLIRKHFSPYNIKPAELEDAVRGIYGSHPKWFLKSQLAHKLVEWDESSPIHLLKSKIKTWIQEYHRKKKKKI